MINGACVLFKALGLIKGRDISIKNKVASKLDVYVIDFIKVLKNYVDYAVVSGQIAFKLYLGSDKDIEDAIYLYEIFHENLNR